MIIERFIKYMDFKGLNDNRVTIDCGLSVGLIGKARKGASDLGRNTIEKILRVYTDLNRDWLLTGKGNMLKEESVSTNSENTNQQSDDMTIQKLLEALERKDKQINALLEQNSNLTAIISRFSGVSPLDDRISPPRTISVNTQDSER